MGRSNEADRSLTAVQQADYLAGREVSHGKGDEVSAHPIKNKKPVSDCEDPREADWGKLGGS